MDTFTETQTPTITTPKLGQTGESLRLANATITKMHDQAIALKRELALKQEAIELLRDCLTEAEQECTILREELARARQVAQ